MPARLLPASKIWPTVTEGFVWACSTFPTCDTYARCHAGTKTPVASMAGPRLRRLRGMAHGVFDPLWKDSTLVSRDVAYMAASLAVDCDDFHIGFLDESGCLRLLDNIECIGEMVDALVQARRKPDPNLSEACIELLLSVYMPSKGSRPIDLAPRAAIAPYRSLQREALLKGAILPEAGQLFRLSADATQQLINAASLE